MTILRNNTRELPHLRGNSGLDSAASSTCAPALIACTGTTSDKAGSPPNWLPSSTVRKGCPPADTFRLRPASPHHHKRLVPLQRDTREGSPQHVSGREHMPVNVLTPLHGLIDTGDERPPIGWRSANMGPAQNNSAHKGQTNTSQSSPLRRTIACEALLMPGYGGTCLTRLAGGPLRRRWPSDHHQECRIIPWVRQDARCCVPIICVWQSLCLAHG